MTEYYSSSLDGVMLQSYLSSLVNRFFKILPIRENEPDSFVKYVESLQLELFGFKELFISVRYDPEYISLLSKLQYMMDHPDAPVKSIRREVFSSISICNKLKARYAIEQKEGDPV